MDRILNIIGDALQMADLWEMGVFAVLISLSVTILFAGSLAVAKFLYNQLKKALS